MIDTIGVLATAGLGVATGYVVARASAKRVELATTRAEESVPDVPDSRFDQLLASLTVGIAIVDAREQVESMNAAAATIFELGSRHVVGRAMIELVPSFDLDRRIREALRGHPSRGRISLTTASGLRMLTVATLPLDGASGVLVIASDETRLFELEQTRRDFISSVSHELRTPLTSIGLMVDTILETDGDEEALDLFLPRVKTEIVRMGQLVGDLLDLARAETGKLELRRERLDLVELARRILATFEPRAEKIGVRLSCTGDALHLDGDPDRLAQVLVNLIDNALRHTTAGGSVDVIVEPRERAATLLVRDTGVGIPFNDLPHIFERFYVVDRSRAREAAGTGLGLPIVKQIVEAHGGSVSVASDFGRGAIFTCVFPMSRPVSAA